MGATIIGMPHDDMSSTVLDLTESACPSPPSVRSHFTDQELAKMTGNEDWCSEPISTHAPDTQQVDADSPGAASSSDGVVQNWTRVFEEGLD